MKTRISLLLAAALLAAAGSCTKRPVQPRFGIAATDTLVSRNGIACKIEYRFASILNAGKSPALTAIEQANIGYFFDLEAFSGTVREAAAAAIGQFADIYLADSLPTGSGNAEYEISAESEGAVVDTLIVYTITQSSYTGGAHGMYSRENYVYSLDGGYEITLADLFTEAQLESLGPADPPETLRTIRRSGRRRARCRRVLPRIHRPDGEFPRHARKHRFLLQSV